MPFTINGTDGLAAGSVQQEDLANGVAGKGPAFSYSHSVGQSIPNGSVLTKALFATQDFDTHNAVSSSRFQPTAAGYYWVKAAYYPAAPLATGVTSGVTLGKNGSTTKIASSIASTAGAAYTILNCEGIVYLNGTTDFVEAYFSHNAASALTSIADTGVKFQGCLVRAA